MRVLKLFMASLCCLMFCFCLCSCSSNQLVNYPTASLSNEQVKENFVGFAIYCDTDNSISPSKVSTLTKNSLTYKNDKLETTNNLVLVVYSNNNFKSKQNLLLSSNTTFNSKSELINNKLNLDINIEIFLETKTAYVFEVLLNNSKLTINEIAKENVSNSLPNTILCKNLTATANSYFNEIKFKFVVDLTTQDEYRK